MNVTHKRLIERWAQEILLDYAKKIGQPIRIPIPIFDIAETFFNLKVDTEKFRGKFDDISAITIPAKNWILLNNDHSFSRRRYSLAHELAHWLTEEYPNTHKSEREWNFGYLQTNNTNLRERNAEYFAAAILMPKGLLQELIKQIRVENSEYIPHLAELLGVSDSALDIRIKQVYYNGAEDPEEKRFNDIFLSACYHPIIQYPSPTLHRYTLVLPPSIIDNRIIRYLQDAARNREHLYFVVDRNHLKYLDSLMEFKYGEGFLICKNIQKELDYFRQSDDVRIIDLQKRDSYYQVLNNISRKDLLKTQLLIYTRDTDNVIPEKQLELTSVTPYIHSSKYPNKRDDAKKYIKICHDKGKKVVIVTGCFDLITDTHIRFLKEAKGRGDVLVVGIESDQRVRAFKGPLRPVNTESQRMEVINALQCVDFSFVIHGYPQQNVTQFYYRLHRCLGADILAVTEGDPYTEDRRHEIESAGGHLAVIQIFPQDGRTTSVLRKFLEETIISDIVFLKKHKLYEWVNKDKNLIKQPRLPLFDE